MKVSIIGQGYVGLPLAIALAQAGNQVIGLDSNSVRIQEISAGHSKIETVSQESLLSVLKSEAYTPTTNPSLIRDSKVFVITVPTPIDSANNPDLSFLQEATSTISKYASYGALVINESTSFPGTLRNVIAPIFNTSREGSDRLIDFACSPERIDPNNKEFNLFNTPRLVGGLSNEAVERAVAFYSSFVKKVIRVTSPEVAEASKLLENTYRLINIAFINEFAEYCAKKEIDVSQVIEAASTKPFGFVGFSPSVGIGGHCIPVDPHYLRNDSENFEVELKITKAALASNLERPARIVKNLKALNLLPPKRVLIEGVTYKPNVSDIRESPSLQLISELKGAGYEVAWHDPIYHSDIKGTQRAKVGEEFDLAILCVFHSVTNLEEVKSRSSRFIDLTFRALIPIKNKS